MKTISRRDFLVRAGIGVSALVCSPDCFAGRTSGQRTCSLISRSNSGSALEMRLTGNLPWITPTECFYVFDRADVFSLNVQQWAITVTGEIERPLKLALTDLGRFHQHSVINTLECAGNGRAFFKPTVPGIQWQRGAVGNAIFSGPRLRDILASAGIRRGVKHVAFTGVDALAPHRQFERSIPLEKAIDAHTLLATRMNGRVLSFEHGFPVRAITPGWIGAASVKRVAEIRLLNHEAEGEFMQNAYRLPTQTEDSAQRQHSPLSAITRLRVKSLICHVAKPQPGIAPVTLSGVAWAGESRISKVEVSTDSGETWHPADLLSKDDEYARYAWTQWSFSWTPPAKGKFLISVRANDSAGHIQPETAQWNPRGYLWNGIDRTELMV